MTTSLPRRLLFNPKTVFAAALLGALIRGHAATIAFTGFELTGDTWTGVTLSGTGGSFSTATGAGDTPALQRILDGTRSFQTASDGTSATPNRQTATVDFDSIDVSAFDSIQLTIRVSSPSGTGVNANDGPDNLKLFVALNGQAFSATPDITLNGNGNARYGFDATLTGTTAAGTPVNLSPAQSGASANNFSTLVITIPNSATSVDFRIQAANDTAGEIWSIDSVSLTGTPVPEPSAAVALFGGLGMLVGFRRFRVAR